MRKDRAKGGLGFERRFRVGEYLADYSGLSDGDLSATDPEADALIARSRVVSSKKGPWP